MFGRSKRISELKRQVDNLREYNTSLEGANIDLHREVQLVRQSLNAERDREKSARLHRKHAKMTIEAREVEIAQLKAVIITLNNADRERTP